MRPKLTTAQAAARCGTTVEHIRLMARQGRIPHYRIGTRYRFDPTELERWLEAHRVTVPEMKA